MFAVDSEVCREANSSSCCRTSESGATIPGIYSRSALRNMNSTGLAIMSHGEGACPAMAREGTAAWQHGTPQKIWKPPGRCRGGKTTCCTAHAPTQLEMSPLFWSQASEWRYRVTHWDRYDAYLFKCLNCFPQRRQISATAIYQVLVLLHIGLASTSRDITI